MLGEKHYAGWQHPLTGQDDADFVSRAEEL